MRSGNGGEGEGAGGARRENIGSWKVMGRKRPRSVLASNEERSHHFRNSRIPKQKMPATRVAAPPAEFMTSCISSRGVSQKLDSLAQGAGNVPAQPEQDEDPENSALHAKDYAMWGIFSQAFPGRSPTCIGRLTLDLA